MAGPSYWYGAGVLLIHHHHQLQTHRKPPGKKNRRPGLYRECARASLVCVFSLFLFDPPPLLTPLPLSPFLRSWLRTPAFRGAQPAERVACCRTGRAERWASLRAIRRSTLHRVRATQHSPGSRTLVLGVVVTLLHVAIDSAKTKRGFLTPTRSHPQLGLAVGCGGVTL